MILSSQQDGWQLRMVLGGHLTEMHFDQLFTHPVIFTPNARWKMAALGVTEKTHWRKQEGNSPQCPPCTSPSSTSGTLPLTWTSPDLELEACYQLPCDQNLWLTGSCSYLPRFHPAVFGSYLARWLKNPTLSTIQETAQQDSGQQANKTMPGNSEPTPTTW